MNTVDIENVNPNVELVSIDDVAAYLNIMYHDVVDVLLEFITIFSDDEMIQEITDILDLNITGVVESTNYGKFIVGYITSGSGNV